MEIATTRLGYSPHEAAYTLGISLKTIQDAIASGELTYRRIGTRNVITVADLEDWFLRFPVAKAKVCA